MARSKPSSRRSTSSSSRTSAADSLEAELKSAGDRRDLRDRIDRLRAALVAQGITSEDWKLIELGRAAKKNYAQRLSTAIAQKTANALRPQFKGILPDALGKGQESKSAGAAGLKKLDVNYSNSTIGLGLAVSIKTTNFKDDATGRFTKNVKRVDGELRAEAQDCHTRQPFAVLAALWFFPAEAAVDGSGDGPSSLVHAAETLARRSGRQSSADDASKFELGFIAVYQEDGLVDFFPAGEAFPNVGLPSQKLTFTEVLTRIAKVFTDRNGQ